jgi:hypothetical protein
LTTDRAKLLQAKAERVEQQAQEAVMKRTLAGKRKTLNLENQTAMFAHAEQIRAA